MLDLIAALLSLVIANSGALFIGLRMFNTFKLPLYLGFCGVLIPLGAACVMVAPRGLPRLATGIGLAITLVTGMALLYPALWR